jgi:hypothetical protein
MFQIAIESYAKHQAQSKNKKVHQKPNWLRSKIVDLVEHPKIAELAVLYCEDLNKMPQRRMFITPTVTLVVPCELEGSNGYLRKFKDKLEFFVRINILSDEFEQPWFNDNFNNDRIFGEYVEPSIEGV